MSNLEIWDKVSRPPQTALKEIKGGRLKGMTDINPQWRYKAMTELYGPCGKGWSYEIVKTWTEAGPDGQLMAFAEIKLHIKGYEWAIPGIGGSALIANESSGPRGNDEAYKMAVTDALSVAMKQLGVGADIYMGRWDGTKYKDTPEETAPTVKIDPKVKREFYEQVKSCLANGDEHGVRELWAEWKGKNEEKLVLWAMFNSQERSAMTAMKATA